MNFAGKLLSPVFLKWIAGLAMIGLLGMTPWHQQTPPAEADTPFPVEYYYKVEQPETRVVVAGTINLSQADLSVVNAVLRLFVEAASGGS